MTELTTLKGGSLHLWASQTIASYWLPTRLNRFHARHPDIALSVTISNTEEICQHLASGMLTLGLIEGAPTQAGLTLTEIARDQLVLVVAPDHPWARTSSMPRNLLEAQWILREKGSGTRASFESALAGWDVDPSRLRIVMELTSNEAIANAISSGRAATVLSASVVAGMIENGLLHHVEMAFPDRRFALVRNDRSLSPAEQAFTTFLLSQG